MPAFLLPRTSPLASSCCLLRLTILMAATASCNGATSCECLSTDALVEVGSGLSSQAGYGIGCLPHDMNMQACDAGANQAHCDNVVPKPVTCDDVPTWCSRSWCYVGEECNVLNEASRYFEDSGHLYSYAACGEPDFFTTSFSVSGLQNKVLRVAFRHNTGGTLGSYHTEAGHGHRDDQWYGPYPELIRRASRDIGFHINITEPPAWITEKAREITGSSSAFTGCTYAAGLGYVDVCVASFAINSARQMYADMLITEYAPLYLVGKEVTGDFLDKMSVAFLPFQWYVWFLIFMASVLMSMLLLVQTREIAVSTDLSNVDEHKKNVGKLGRQFVGAVYLGFAGFLGSPGLTGLFVAKSKTVSSKFTVIGMIWFNRLCFFLYMSKLSVFLINAQKTMSVVSVEDAMQRDFRFCVPRWNLVALRGMYGQSLNAVIDPADGIEGILSRKNLLAYMDDGTCDASFMMDDDLAKAHATDTEHCSKDRIGLPVTSLPRGIPVFSKVGRGLGNWFLKFEGRGEWKTVLSEAKLPSKCGGAKASAGFDIIDLSAAFGVAIVLVGVGIAIDVAKEMRSRAAQKAMELADFLLQERREAFVQNRAARVIQRNAQARTLYKAARRAVIEQHGVIDPPTDVAVDIPEEVSDSRDVPHADSSPSKEAAPAPSKEAAPAPSKTKEEAREPYKAGRVALRRAVTRNIRKGKIDKDADWATW